MTAPALAIDGGGKIGRLYYNSTVLEDTNIDRKSLVRSKAAIADSVRKGLLVPSITNIIGVRSLPFLQQWYANLAAKTAVAVELEFPGRISQHPQKAYEYIRYAALRDVTGAAEQGDIVHKAAESLGNEEAVDYSELNEAQRKHLDSWKAWVDRWQPEFLGQEVTAFGETTPGLGYAGTCDAIVRINGYNLALDYKTTRSGLHDSISLQLAATVRSTYVTYDNVTLTETPKLDGAIGVHLSPDGYQVKPVHVDDELWATFTGLRAAWDFHVFEGVLKSGRNSLGPAVASPEKMCDFFAKQDS